MIALVTAFVCAPLIAWATGSRFYLTRQAPQPLGRWRRFAAPLAAVDEGRYGMRRCCICERDYERDDMAHCPRLPGPDLLAVLHAGCALQ